MIERWVSCRAWGMAGSPCERSSAGWIRRVPCWSTWAHCSRGNRTTGGDAITRSDCRCIRDVRKVGDALDPGVDADCEALIR